MTVQRTAAPLGSRTVRKALNAPVAAGARPRRRSLSLVGGKRSCRERKNYIYRRMLLRRRSLPMRRAVTHERPLLLPDVPKNFGWGRQSLHGVGAQGFQFTKGTPRFLATRLRSQCAELPEPCARPDEKGNWRGWHLQ